MIFTDIQPSDTKLSTTSIQDLRNDFQEKRLTGFIRVDLGKNCLLYIFYNQGQTVFAFLRQEGKNAVIAPDIIKETIGRVQGTSVRNAILSLPALRICKYAICHPSTGSTHTTVTNQLPQLFDKCEKDKEACILRIRWKNAEGVALFGGEGWSTAVLFTPEGTREGNVDAIFPAWTEADCEVTRFSLPQDSDAWQEYHLQQAFASICAFMFKRYQEFTGSGLVQSVIWMMAEAAAAEQLNVKVRQLQLEDQNLFAGPEKAAQAYRLLIAKLTGRIRALLGPALLNSITADAAFELSPNQRTVARIHRLLELSITIPILREPGGIS
jgi:hypothetical protein